MKSRGKDCLLFEHFLYSCAYGGNHDVMCLRPCLCRYPVPHLTLEVLPCEHACMVLMERQALLLRISSVRTYTPIATLCIFRQPSRHHVLLSFIQPLRQHVLLLYTHRDVSADGLLKEFIQLSLNYTESQPGSLVAVSDTPLNIKFKNIRD